MNQSEWINKLYFGDNLEIMRDFMPDESVDLIYIDPPFNSKASYNVLFKEKNGTQSGAQIEAFDDTWYWGEESEETYRELITQESSKLTNLMEALRKFLGSNDMMAYLTMMAIRLVVMQRILKSTGSIYLHCDPTASHYLKLVTDAIYGNKNFLNEIIWYYRGAGTPKKTRAKRHDILLHYAKDTSSHYFDPDPIRRSYAPATQERFSHYIGNVREGHDYGIQELHPLGKHPDDVIADIQPIAPSAKERLGYPTQKPEELLEEIIRASSKKGDIVMDCFCGCGTTISVAERLERKWIGIDITYLAISLIRQRLNDSFGNELSSFKVLGEPTTIAEAKALAKQDRDQFEKWALSISGARPSQDKKKGADKGIDGKISFFDDDSEYSKKIIIQVKSGKIGPDQVRDLKGTMEREEAVIGVFITLHEPTKQMKTEAIEMGYYQVPNTPQKYYPKLQILTIEDILNGEKIKYPQELDTTFRKAKRKTKSRQTQGNLPIDNT